MMIRALGRANALLEPAMSEPLYGRSRKTTGKKIEIERFAEANIHKDHAAKFVEQCSKYDLDPQSISHVHTWFKTLLTDNETIVMDWYSVEKMPKKMTLAQIVEFLFYEAVEHHVVYAFKSAFASKVKEPRKMTEDKLKKACALCDFSLLELINAAEKKAFELDKWIDVARRFFLCKKDIDSLEEGEKVRVICLDRNVGDTVRESNEAKKAYTVERFFRESMATYTHGVNGGATGTIHFEQEQGDEASDPQQPFTFEVEYAQHSWYPLSKKGCLPVYDLQKQKLFNINNRLHDGTEPKCWNEFEATTLVGLRGPMLRVDRVKKLPRHLSKVWFD